MGRLAGTRAGRFLVGEVTDATLDATVGTLRSEAVNVALADAIDDGLRARVEATSR